MRTRLLGGLEVEGLRPTEIGSRKARTLVKVLALGRGAPVPAGRVVEALWGDEPPARPLEQVGVLVSRLRAVFGPDRLGRDDGGWSLHTDWLDVTELDERVAEAQERLATGRPAAARAAARAALALVRGDLLADEPDAPWAVADRVAVARQVARARLLAARAALAMGDPADAVAGAQAVLDADPYDEVALRVLLRAQVAAGRPGAALAAYERARSRLAEDLGADPAEETRRLHEEILRGEPAAPVPQTRPAGPVRFVGRAAELADLDARLVAVTHGGAGLVEVVGEAGIGKTALVTRWAAGLGDRATVLVGRCAEPGVMLPLQPVLDALDAHLRDGGGAVGGAAGTAGSSAEILGTDAALVGPLLASADPLPAGAGASPAAFANPATGQALLFAALLRVLARAGGTRPVVLVVDDVARADPATEAWLGFAVRRGSRLLVVTTHRGAATGPGGLELGPLDAPAVAELVGAERAAGLHARSGGNPLFLSALAAADPDDLPDTIRASVDARATALGPAATTLRVAAVLGRDIDVDLLAAVLGLGVRELLTHLEEGAAAGLVDDHGAVPAFAHDLVREALADSTTAARRAFTHREAARLLAGRPGADPLAVAHHARLGGDTERAADALIAAAALAVARHDLTSALAHCDAAVNLADGPAARAARARVLLLRLDLPAAAADAERALVARTWAADLELAGWIAYYRRDYGAALRFAEAGRERADGADGADGAVIRASCALLIGRLRHTRGDLAAADGLLTAAADTGPAPVRGLARAWLASLRGHQGRADEALALAERTLIDDLDHPFAAGHVLFAAAYAHGLRGEPAAALAVVDRFDALIEGQGEQLARFVGIAANLRGWLLRGLGREDRARDCNAVAVALAPGPTRDEPRGAGGLDLVDGRLGAGDLDGAAAELDRLGWIADWQGSMAWRQRHRFVLLTARLALAGGDAVAAEEAAAGVLTDATGRGAARYRALAAVVVARARAAQGAPVDRDAVAAALAALDRVAGLEAWWVTAEAAAALGEPRWWALADRRAAALVAVAGPDAESLQRAVAARFAALGRR
ncbi:ATP-binding protein [Pseudonocardia sp.]|uniref:ATP-binding protein n=1 Tax=Pseudonocardia sp. TaxID=60912 RepID=UPI003D14774A